MSVRNPLACGINACGHVAYFKTHIMPLSIKLLFVQISARGLQHIYASCSNEILHSAWLKMGFRKSNREHSPYNLS